MIYSFDEDRDLVVSRTIKAPPALVWDAWTDPRSFEQWWVPQPAKCRAVRFEPTPGGALETEISEDGGPFSPHLKGCFLHVVQGARLVFTTALVGGWRPAENPFLTAIISILPHAEGTNYSAYVMHKDAGDQRLHRELGFHDGWGSVADQLAVLAEARAGRS